MTTRNQPLKHNHLCAKAPWSFETGRISSAEGWCLGSVSWTLGDETDAANGTLMALAPELRNALREARAQLKTGKGQKAHKIIDDAIKACDSSIRAAAKLRLTDGGLSDKQAEARLRWRPI